MKPELRTSKRWAEVYYFIKLTSHSVKRLRFFVHLAGPSNWRLFEREIIRTELFIKNLILTINFRFHPGAFYKIERSL